MQGPVCKVRQSVRCLQENYNLGGYSHENVQKSSARYCSFFSD